MASSFEKSVKGATKIKAAPPKTKYIEHILIATHAGEAGVGEVFRALQYRLADSAWTVVLKGLITIHLMIREGSPDVTLSYLAKHRNMLQPALNFQQPTQNANIRDYARYLFERAQAYRETRVDWVRGRESRLETLSIEKGLLRETEAVEKQMDALLRCDVMDSELENEITVTIFRLLVLDLLNLFEALNQGMINILGHFFEMSKTDAERALDIYRTFIKQTDAVVRYLSVARQYELHTRVEVQKLKHAPVTLGRQLEEYLRDPDFDVNRRQYLAELEIKKGKGGSAAAAAASRLNQSDAAKASFSNGAGAVQPAAKPAAQTAAAKGPEAVLIDFFDSIEQQQHTPIGIAGAQQQQQQQQQPQQPQQHPPQQTMQSQPQLQQAHMGSSPWNPAQLQAQQAYSQNGFAPQQQQQPPPQLGFQAGGAVQQLGLSHPQQQLQPSFTGAPNPFGGMASQPTSFASGSLQPIPQDGVAMFQTGMPTGFQPQQQPGGLQPQPQVTNPFRASMMSQQTGSPFGLVQQQQQQPMTSAATSTNPFQRASMLGIQPLPSQPTSATTMSPFQATTSLPLQQPQQLQQQQAPNSIMPIATGTNPFAKSFSQQQTGQQQQPQPQQQQQQQQQPRPSTSGGLMPQSTGTNPFRQGAFVNHATGLGWQHNQTSSAIGGGLDQLEPIPVFPRPAQQTPWQQQG